MKTQSTLGNAARLKRIKRASIDESETQSEDRPLFRLLRLKPFSTTSRAMLRVGTVKHARGSEVEISVECCPAQFWTFKVKSGGGRETVIKTGSGPMNRYWPTIAAMLEGMIVVESLTEGGAR